MFTCLEPKKSGQEAKPTNRAGANCFICGHCYKTERAASYHSVLHSQEGYFNCPLCEEKFPRYDSLVWHLHISHKEQAPRCHMCGHMYLSFKVLETHCCCSFGGQPLLCKECCIDFADVHAFLNQHHCMKDKESFFCPCCHSNFADRGTFGGHLSRHLGEGFFACKVCNRTFTRRKSLYNHEKTHDFKGRIACKHCEKSFKSVASVVKHGRQVHGPKNYKCHLCTKVFGLPGYLRQHVMVKHTRNRMLSNFSKADAGGDLMQNRSIADLHSQQSNMSTPDFPCTGSDRVKKEMGSFHCNSRNGAEVKTGSASRRRLKSNELHAPPSVPSAFGIKVEEEDLAECASRPTLNSTSQLRRKGRSTTRNLSSLFCEGISLFLTKSGRRIYFSSYQIGIQQPKVILRDLYASQKPQKLLAASKPVSGLSLEQNYSFRPRTRQSLSPKKAEVFSQTENIRSTMTCLRGSCSKSVREACKRSGRAKIGGVGINLSKRATKQSPCVRSRKRFSELPIFQNCHAEDSSDEELELPG